LLESATHRAQAFAFDVGVDLASQSAALTQGIAQNQPFVDGNKRAAYAAGVVFLRANGHPLVENARDELAEKIIDLGGSNDAPAAHEEQVSWLHDHLT
jgi:death-on-curing protein